MASETLNGSDNAPTEDDRVHLGKLALVFIGFAILYLATAYYFDLTDQTKTESSVTTGQLYGPIETTSKNTLIEIELINPDVHNSWSFVQTTVLDEKKRYVTGFGSNFFHESGRSYEGNWVESEARGDVKITLPDPGKYFLKFAVSGARTNDRTGQDLTQKGRLDVTVRHKKGTSAFYLILGLAILVIGVILNEVRNQTIISVVSIFTRDD
jgi:hypothetical protein